MLVLFSLKHLFVRLRTFCVMHFQRTFLGKGEAKGTPLEPRQGRSPAPPFPNSSLDFALVRRLNISLIAIISAFCLLLATTIATQANTVNISDPAHVLNADQVRSEAANLPDP